MDVAFAQANFSAVQSVLQAISLLNLTSIVYPQNAEITDGATYDYIIAGAGSAGCVLANRLTEDPQIKVLLIEAGGDPPIESNVPGLLPFNFKSEHDWNFLAVSSKCSVGCLQNSKQPFDNGKLLGGGSSINFMLYNRGNPHDYDNWAAIANDQSWNFNNIFPYFLKSERLNDPEHINYAKNYGAKGPVGIEKVHYNEIAEYLQAFQETGYRFLYDTNSNQSLGYGQPYITIADGIRQSTANAYLSPIVDRPNLFVLKNAFVKEIDIKDKVAKGVNVIDKNDKILSVHAKKEVIISAGSINTPKILMMSGIGPSEHLHDLNIEVISDLPVGKNLQNHWNTVLPYKMTNKIANKIPKPLTRYRLPIITGNVALNKTQTYPDYQTMSLLLDDQKFLTLCLVMLAFDPKICHQLFQEIDTKELFLAILVKTHPKSRGQVLLKSKDYKDDPLIYSQPYTDEEDLEDNLKYIKDFVRVVNSTYFKEQGAELYRLPKCAGYTFGSEDYWRCYAKCLVSNEFNPTGTCSLGSVVNSKLQVYGVKNLRVVDASIMPCITSGHTNAPTIVIAEKAADMIKEKAKNSN